MKVDMSPEAITGRMMMLDQLWELAVLLKNSTINGPVEQELRPKPPLDSAEILKSPTPLLPNHVLSTVRSDI